MKNQRTLIMIAFLLAINSNAEAQSGESCTSEIPPAGWVKVDTHTDASKCNGGKNIYNNVARIESIAGRTEMHVCSDQPMPSGWLIKDVYSNFSQCMPRRFGAQLDPRYGTMAHIIRPEAISLYETNICANQQLPPSWTFTSSHTVSGSCVHPNSAHNTWNQNNVWTVRNNSVTCSLSVSSTSVAPGAQFTFSIGGRLPDGAVGYWYGTKNETADAHGVPFGTVPKSLSYDNPPASAGTYTRYAKIYDRSGSLICTTPTVTVQLMPPVCQLSSSASIVSEGQDYSFTSTIGSSVPSGSVGYWFGTKDGTPDANGEITAAIPSSYTYTHRAGWAGTYVRWLDIRNGAELQCRTNKIQIILQ